MVSVEYLQTLLSKRHYKLLESALYSFHHNVNRSKDQLQQIENELLTVYFKKPNFHVLPTTTCALLVYYYFRLCTATFSKINP